MKKLIYIIAILFVLSLFQVFAIPRTQSITPEKNYKVGQLLVKFKDGPYSLITVRAHAETGATVLQNFDPLGWQLVELPEGVSVDEGLAAYRKISDCLLAQPNFTYHIYNTPNDPQFGTMYGMTKISAPTAWDTTTGNPAVVVADIDTGVDYNHQDLAANMWHNPGETPNNSIDDDNNGFVDDYYGYDFINNDSNPFDDHGHGTHTTGTIGAVGNNSIGVVGVKLEREIDGFKTHAGDGNSTAATVIAAFNYVTMMKNRGINIRVTSNSWGGAPEAAGYDQALKDAIDATGNAGVLNAFAAGNDGRDIEVSPSYPASYNSPSIISVASSTNTDARSSFSNWGVTSVDVAAPGSSILSTFPNNTYGTISGTSMATPHVAGAAALLVGLNANLSVASLKATLINTVDAVAAFNGLVVSGGRINVSRALSQQTVCSFSLSQNSQSATPAGGNGSVNVTAQSACSWGAFSNANWITVTSAAGATGNGTVNFTIAQNAGSARSGTISIAGQTFTVNQTGNLSGGSDTIGLYRPSTRTFYLRNSNSVGVADLTIPYGDVGDMPLAGDWDGDGTTTIGLYRPSTRTFYLRNSNSAGFADLTIPYGDVGDTPIAGDWDGDGTTTIGLYRPNTRTFYLRNSNSAGFADLTIPYGDVGDTPIAGDWDGDGTTTIGLYRPSTRTFYLRNSNSVGIADLTVPYGDVGDMPLAGDWDGDGTTTIGLYRPSTRTFYLRNSNSAGFADLTVPYGDVGDTPIAGNWDGQ